MSPVFVTPTFPVTILFNPFSRHWAALPYHEDELEWPEDWSNVAEVEEFWRDMSSELVGRGATPNDALADLAEKLEAQGGYECWAEPAKYRMEDAWGR